MLTPNYLLKRRYKILSWVGQGGMGVVYKAEDLLSNNRLVAVKEMNSFGLPPEAVEAFEQEAYLLAHLSHPYLPSIYDYFYDARGSYIVMDFIEGESLEQYLQKAPGGRLSLNETLRLGMKLCDVLHYLHSHEPPIIFRDLKPANIMRTSAGEIFLIDFGLAGFFNPGQDKDSMAYGSIGYAAPEQFGRLTTPQSDIYSLGAVLHQMLSGSDPATNTPDLFTFSPLLNVPVELKRLIEQMVQLDTANRPISIQAVKHELQKSALLQELHQLACLLAGKSPLPATRAALEHARVSKQRRLSLSQLPTQPQSAKKVLCSGFSAVAG